MTTSEGLPVKMKISEEITVSIPTFNIGKGKQYVKCLEDFKFILHKKGLHAKYHQYEESRDACQAEFDLHKTGKP